MTNIWTILFAKRVAQLRGSSQFRDTLYINTAYISICVSAWCSALPHVHVPHAYTCSTSVDTVCSLRLYTYCSAVHSPFGRIYRHRSFPGSTKRASFLLPAGRDTLLPRRRESRVPSENLTSFRIARGSSPERWMSPARVSQIVMQQRSTQCIGEKRAAWVAFEERLY